MEKNKMTNRIEEITSSFTSLFENVDLLISEMKHKSSDEILNGSVEEAQKLLSQILPYQVFYRKLKVAKDSFDQLNIKSKEKVAKSKSDDKAEVEDVIDKSEYTSQINFRIPVLKGLIFLGGSSEKKEIIDFVRNDMKNKLTESDHEIMENEDQEKWITNLYYEATTMEDEGLLTNISESSKWEIAQKGIDYLGKYAK